MSEHAVRTIRIRDILKGIGLVIVMHFLPAVIPMIYFIIGLFQFVYIIPALIICRRNKGMIVGILIATGLTLIVNAIWFSVVMNQPDESAYAAMKL